MISSLPRWNSGILFSCIYRSKSHHPKESIEMVKCEAYEAVNISRHISEAQAEGEYETIM